MLNNAIGTNAAGDYVPQPLDTSAVVIPAAILDLCETLARNTHEVWSQRRLADGWRFGPERSDALKTHPCLVPYEALPEADKEYDRQTALETIRLILKIGYQIKQADEV
jgi:hypothetical protein